MILGYLLRLPPRAHHHCIFVGFKTLKVYSMILRLKVRKSLCIISLFYCLAPCKRQDEGAMQGRMRAWIKSALCPFAHHRHSKMKKTCPTFCENTDGKLYSGLWMPAPLPSCNSKHSCYKRFFCSTLWFYGIATQVIPNLSHRRQNTNAHDVHI